MIVLRSMEVELILLVMSSLGNKAGDIVRKGRGLRVDLHMGCPTICSAISSGYDMEGAR